eukprot:6468835-Pyramimonas_sp.AAC.1
MAPSLRRILAAAMGGHVRTLPATSAEEESGAHFARQLASKVNPAFLPQQSRGVGGSSRVA